ncbi:hypothetical protein R1sor_001028 [Riccia sorocarpa]|uniref:DUF4283 domain-containing protein n=1 Tax=Riccia sorocarpa TaxID=122646 RepID=A0ABD3GZ03_9MARC
MREELVGRRGWEVCQVRALNRRDFLIVFEKEEDRMLFLPKPPKFLDGKLVVSLEWDGNLEVVPMNDKLKAVWVELQNVPPFLEDQAECMLAAIGPVAFSAVNTMEATKYSHVRGCVLLDLSLDLPQKVVEHRGWKHILRTLCTHAFPINVFSVKDEDTGHVTVLSKDNRNQFAALESEEEDAESTRSLSEETPVAPAGVEVTEPLAETHAAILEGKQLWEDGLPVLMEGFGEWEEAQRTTTENPFVEIKVKQHEDPSHIGNNSVIFSSKILPKPKKNRRGKGKKPRAEVDSDSSDSKQQSHEDYKRSPKLNPGRFLQSKRLLLTPLIISGGPEKISINRLPSSSNSPKRRDFSGLEHA